MRKICAGIRSLILYLLSAEGMGLALLAIFLLLFFFDPSAYGFYPPCIFRIFTGYYCPGCGSGQAFYYLMHGDLAAAFYYNPLAVLLLPLLLTGISLQILQGRGLIRRQPSLPAGFIVALLLLVLLYWWVRNTGMYPLFPAPKGW